MVPSVTELPLNTLRRMKKDGILQLNLSIMNPGYNEPPDITNIDFKLECTPIYFIVNKP